MATLFDFCLEVEFVAVQYLSYAKAFSQPLMTEHMHTKIWEEASCRRLAGRLDVEPLSFYMGGQDYCDLLAKGIYLRDIYPTIKDHLVILAVTLLYYPWMFAGIRAQRYCIGCTALVPAYPQRLSFEHRHDMTPSQALEQYFVCPEYPVCYIPSLETSKYTLVRASQEGFVPNVGFEMYRIYSGSQERMRAFLMSSMIDLFDG